MGVEGEGIEFRAFRGDRRSSVYREYVIACATFASVLAAAREQGLPLLASLGARGGRRLEPDEADRLAREASALGEELPSPTLAAHLAAIADIARWCSRARGRSWMTIAAS
ncbi:MAG TPA: hypothetical protein VG265_11625 [Gaiellaceae bacterium]|jgi:hypothetical protein|nr:hypothetical protein [Gaiellaceae bacterium]